MKTKTKPAASRFGRQDRFQLEPAPEPNLPAKTDELLEQFKNRLLKQQVLAGSENPLPTPALRRAANEAAALAWLTPYPLLLLPVLFEEKVASARERALRQDSVRRRSQRLLAEAA
jgi:hypothetical protein